MKRRVQTLSWNWTWDMGDWEWSLDVDLLSVSLGAGLSLYERQIFLAGPFFLLVISPKA